MTDREGVSGIERFVHTLASALLLHPCAGLPPVALGTNFGRWDAERLNGAGQRALNEAKAGLRALSADQRPMIEQAQAKCAIRQIIKHLNPWRSGRQASIRHLEIADMGPAAIDRPRGVSDLAGARHEGPMHDRIPLIGASARDIEDKARMKSIRGVCRIIPTFDGSPIRRGLPHSL